MKLSARMVLAATILVAVGALVDETADIYVTRNVHYDRVDEVLSAATSAAWVDGDSNSGDEVHSLELSELFGSSVFQVVGLDGAVHVHGAGTLPVDDEVRALLDGRRSAPVLRTLTLDGHRFRYSATARPGLGVAQAAVRLDHVEGLVEAPRSQLAAVALITLAVGIALALVVARRLTKPLSELSEASRQVARTGVLDVDVDVRRNDEVGVLAESFRQMLGALSTARGEQRQMVEDLGHELRTPLTSLQTNIEMLERYPEMGPEVRDDIVDALAAEVREMSQLVDRLRDSWELTPDRETPAVVRVDVLVDDLVDRYRRRTTRVIDLRTTALELHARSNCLRGAVGNLIDNALKFDNSGEPVEVTVGADGVWVRDHGPGIPSGETDLIFHRFHRGVGAGEVPGTGIGLSIVRETAMSHGGYASAYNHPDGGAVVGFTLRGLGADD